jgi:hypothetical protein
MRSLVTTKVFETMQNAEDTKKSQVCGQPNTKDYGFGQTDRMGQFADGVGHIF